MEDGLKTFESHKDVEVSSEDSYVFRPLEEKINFKNQVFETRL